MTNYTEIREEELRQAKLELERVGEKLEGLDNANVGIFEKIFKFPSRLRKKAQREVALTSMAKRVRALHYLRPFLNEDTEEAYGAVAWMSDILADESNRRLPKHVKAVYTGLTKEIQEYKIRHNLSIVGYVSKIEELVEDSLTSEEVKDIDSMREEIDGLEWLTLNVLHEKSPERVKFLNRLGKQDNLAYTMDEIENGLYSLEVN